MKQLTELLDKDIGEAIDWLEDNANDYILVPKRLLTEEPKYGYSIKDNVIDCVEAIEDGAPRGEILDSLDFTEDMLYTLHEITKLI